MTSRQSHGTDRRGFAQVTGWPVSIHRQQPQPADDARSEHTYGGPLGRRCCTFLLYSLFEPFEFRF